MQPAAKDAKNLVPLSFTLNGETVKVDIREDETLLELLRERLGYRSLKDGCSPQGQCGACTVLLDDKAVTSCAMKAVKVEGRRVVTLDGFPAQERTLWAKAFVSSGAVQCGFCIPGFVARAKNLLDKNPQPTRPEIEKAVSTHLCRCTGYKKIIDAIDLVSKIKAGEAALPEGQGTGRIGEPLHRHLGEKYALGDEPYVDDHSVPGMLHGALRLADHARAIVRRVDTATAEALPGVVAVIGPDDVPGVRKYGAIEQDWVAFVAEGETTHTVGDVIVAVVAQDRHTARKAAELVEIDYEVLEPLVDPKANLADGAARVHEDRPNLLSTTEYARGDVDRALQDSAHRVQGTWKTQTIEHAFMEPESCLALPDDKGGLKVLSQSQGVYDDRRQLARILGVPDERIRVQLVSNGGGFGGKEDLSVQAQTAVAAHKLGRPVKITLTRDQSIRLHPKRHPMEMEYDVGCDAEGKLTAARIRIVGDTGAYASVGAKVVERAAGHACSAYHVPNVDVRAHAVYTNNPPNGAMRGFGVNQTAFAMEQVLDMLGEKVGKDPYQMRELNLLRDGERFAPGQIMRNCDGLRRTLEAVKDHYYGAKLAGIACGIKNVGIGNGMDDVGRARIKVRDDGTVELHHGMTEMGQGLHTIAKQCFCEETGLPPETVAWVGVKTEEGLDCGMTTASRATVLVGSAMRDAGERMRAALDEVGGDPKKLAGRSFDGTFVCDWTVKPGTPVDDPVTHLSFGFATQVVILDEETGKLKKVVAAHDVGKVLNPPAAEGQIQGSVHMGLGYALSEELVLEEGVPTNATMRKLGVLRAHQTPDIEVIFVEEPEPRSKAYGARGMGEIGLVPTAPATAAALYKYDGKRRYVLPMKDNYEGK